MRKMKELDWSRPQRQPAAGLAVVFLNTIWEIIRRLWPVLIVILLGGKNKMDKFEIFAIVFLAITILAALFRFFYFRFYIEEEKLIVKKGWLNKETKVIPLEKIQTVHLEQGPMHQLLNIVKLSIDTAGSQKTEATIDALHQSMATALRSRLLSQAEKRTDQPAEAENKPTLPIMQLNSSDLLKLSVSANHLEAFFILLSFGFGLYDNLRNIDNSIFPGMEDIIPAKGLASLLSLLAAVLLITILVSTIRIFLRFYHFRMYRSEKGYQLRSGLTNIKERLVGLRKVQFISWKANWIRKLMGLWLFEYHVAGGNELKETQKVQIPVTRKEFIASLASDYHAVPDTTERIAVRMDPSFITRRVLLVGLLPAAMLVAASWWLWDVYSLLFIMLPAIVFIISWSVQRKFRLWAIDDILYLKKGIFGEERIMLQWHRLQNITITQSFFQRRKRLASLALHTAGGTVAIRFISLDAAAVITNYALFRTESSHEGWM